MDTTLRHDVGTEIAGYRIDRIEPLEHLGGTYYELTHLNTGAQHIHIAATEGSKAFCVQFPTLPRNSTGVAHILEHVVLAGSQRYPVRDPFFSMTSRSVSDFMNAMTAFDSTAYPFSTRNEQDFFNLLDVYLDAAFFPRLEENSFRQEGHRLEFETTEDPSTPLRIKGVVFNEMKGAMASDAAVAGRAVGKALFPGSTYENNSGGDPLEIPDLTWEDLKAFHAAHYHPSNAQFYTYGDVPLERILEHISERVMDRFEPATLDVAIPDQPRFAEPVRFRDVYPADDGDQSQPKSQVSCSWLTTRVANPFDTLSLRVLSEILLGNAGSPLRKALIDSGLGEDISDLSGIATNFREAVFSAGLKGVDEADTDAVERLVIDTLDRIATDGLDPEMVEAAIHQYELATREVTNERFPYALRAFMWLRAAYRYGGDPYRALRMDADFERLRAEIAAGPFFEDLIRRHLVSNPHRATIVIAPDSALHERQRTAEEARIAQVSEALTEEDRQRIVETTVALKREQEAQEDTSVLPMLDLSEISLDVEDPDLHTDDAGPIRFAASPQPTNGLVYVTVRATLDPLPDALRDRLGLFVRALHEVGAGDHDYDAQALRIDRYTGGISGSVKLRPSPDGKTLHQQLLVQGKALAHHTDALVDILGDMLGALRFTPERIADVAAEHRSEITTRLPFLGQLYALDAALAQLTPWGALTDRIGGLANLATLKALTAEGADHEQLCAELDAVRDTLFRGPNLAVCVTADDRDLAKLSDRTREMLASLPTGGLDPQRLPDPVRTDRYPARTTAVPVTYSAKAFDTVPFTHDDAAALMVLGKHLRRKYLHKEIREKGGAYGSMGRQDIERGVFTFWSYRDPNVKRTFDVFSGAPDHATADDAELREAILQALREVDPLTSPDIKGRDRFLDDLCGYTAAEQSRFKERVLSVSPEDLKRVADAYLRTDDFTAAVFGNPELIAEADEQMGGTFEISAV